jgi:hypothetical protein
MPWRERFLIHEIGRVDVGRGFQTGKNVFRIGGNTFYDQKNKIPMKIPEFKRSGIRLIAEFCRIPNRFPNQVGNGIGQHHGASKSHNCGSVSPSKDFWLFDGFLLLET